MSERMITVELLPPHLKTEEGARRFDAAVEQRNQADYECFLVLRELNDDGMLYKGFFLRALKADPDTDRAEAEEMAEHHAERVKEALKKRRDADAEFSDALLGRS